MDEKILIDLIPEALQNSDKINYTVKIQSGKGLQVETSEKRHYNILIRDIDRLKGHIIKIRHETGKR